MARALAQRDLDAAQQAGLGSSERKLLEFVEVCVKYPYRVTDELVEELRQTGYSDEQIAEAALNVALFLALTTMADVYGLPDSGFHLREQHPDIDPEEDEVIVGDLDKWRKKGV